MINQTSFTDPMALSDVPRGGTIREIVTIDFIVPSGTYIFYVLSFYGVGITMEEILSQLVAYNYITIEAVQQQYTRPIDTPIDVNAPVGTYSCATVIADDFDGSTIYGIYDSKVDANVLTITPGLGATIISTSFSSM